jgi:hypothetical protein
MPDQLALDLPPPRRPRRPRVELPPARYPRRAVRPLPARVLAGLARHGVALVSYGWLARPGALARDAVLLRLPVASVDQKAPEVWYTRDEAADLLSRLEGRAK